MEDASVHERRSKQPPPLAVVDDDWAKRSAEHQQCTNAGSAGARRFDAEGEFASIGDNENGKKSIGKDGITGAIESRSRHLVFVLFGNRTGFLQGPPFGFKRFGCHFRELVEYRVRTAL
ncbi:hypothetical protein [Rhizobium sp. M10]|uniref:hypothetical protein n=1 Tax=Rhizobium sp. M10 TaxID=1324586 RepID=UPI001FE114E5|nr:hypothetical protein [Rhizobium sp. M10]